LLEGGLILCQPFILATSFHPELTRDVSLHKQFVKMVADSKS